ncbi:hematopoietic progenitor cell antigen CD34 [Thamnophis elegans]|uniref:hematopoietic progenitor cell antigen CD34 n=1 Tax=Thamnophis elegans TaxID=35005 RepID=UPI001378C9D6|nr:hematopoietic progenitor cell antigen CD34 [Thamnophis elegans]
MMLMWSFKIMKERQLLWATFYVLCLFETPVSGVESVSSSISPNTTIITEKLTTIIAPSSASTITPLSSTVISLKETSSNATKPETFAPSIPTTNVISPNTTATSVTTQWNAILTTNNETTTQNLSSTSLLTNEPTKPTTDNSTVFLNTAMTENNNLMFNITCMKIKQLSPATEVVCLELHEVQSCENFKRNKGEGLSKLVCKKKEVPCHIELANSDMNHHCMLLLAVNNTENIRADALCVFLDGKKPDLKALGIKSHKQERTEIHQVHSRGTLIALVTTGLLLAFLGLAGYYLMRRRSWSPMGERLGEDPYYIENDSHGNPEIPVASQEQPDLQDKPNLNGGARENGTGQPSSKNGHQTKPQVVADTEL